MTEIFRSRLFVVWLLLVGLSLLSLEFLRTLSIDGLRWIGAATIMLVALVKSAVVGAEYMELSFAPWPLRLFFYGLLSAVSVAIVIIYVG